MVVKHKTINIAGGGGGGSGISGKGFQMYKEVGVGFAVLSHFS